MHALLEAAKKASHEHKPLPFSVYSSVKEQRILNAPIAKPLMVFVLAGIKQLGKDSEITCPAGRFVFLSNNTNIDMRNIPDVNAYCAVLVEFEYCDFDQFKDAQKGTRNYFQGEIDTALATTLQQFIEWSMFAPSAAWHFRRKELLQLLYQSGYEDVCAIAAPPSLSHRLHGIINDDISADWPVERLAAKLAISESTLRRKLQAEGSSIHAIVNRAKLGHGLHLVQTTMAPIGRIAERCGYQSQSRFTDKFKQLFGITPSALRKTRRPD
ncbi:AraC family transcriptional regulator [Jeongeupia wiesaeckerbachi]|uniref:helix-turn-helix transcriptional regulator n=1 Tax=Jeongeupia wiesaeckerbachi TaxID=3051218 RepID=UPI003D8047D3